MQKQTPTLFYNFPLTALECHHVLLSIVVVYAVLQGKFQGHPGGKGIMTGLLSGEEEEEVIELSLKILSLIPLNMFSLPLIPS